MMSFSDERILKYIEDHLSEEDKVLAELNRITHLKVLNPRMLSGHLQGKLLEMISQMIKPKYILEIGTYTGYSAICLAKGLKNNGKLYTIEIIDEFEDLIRKFIGKANLEDKIELIIGDACKIIPELDKVFDLVFIDADKKQYKKYYELALPKLNKGGFILVDNVLWSGKVVEEISIQDEETESIIEFNSYVQNDSRVENLILPIRDGISLIRKR